VIHNSICTIIDNLNIDLCLLNELKKRRVINEQILIDVLSRPNRPEKVVCLSEHLLQLGPQALRDCGDVLQVCGNVKLASVMERLLLEERDKAWSRPVKPNN